MKKVLSMLLAVIVLSSAFTMTVFAETITANPTTSKVIINGEEKSFEAYNINDNNYFKLRDICESFNISVNWDEQQQLITVDHTKPYKDIWQKVR